MYEPLAGQLGAAFTAVGVIEWLKKSHLFPWLTCDTEKLNRVVSLVVAGVASLGVTINTVGTWTSGSTITIVVPPANAILEAAYRFAIQVGLQKSIYKLTSAQVLVVKEPTASAGEAAKRD